MRDESENAATCRACLRLIHENIDLNWLRMRDHQAQALLGSDRRDDLVTHDDRISNAVSYAYRELFAADRSHWISTAFEQAMLALKGRSFAESQDDLQTLRFLHHVFAVALWKHHLPLEAHLEKFTRDFDRLDVHTERERLHALAQT